MTGNTTSCVLVSGEPVANIAIATKTCKTKAPPLLTEATLLRAMETAGKSLDDKQLSDAMKEKGIGTPATRAATIEKLNDSRGKKRLRKRTVYEGRKKLHGANG